MINVMEHKENESITAIVQFRTQLVQLRDAFLGVPIEERTSAALAVGSLLDELLHFCGNPHSFEKLKEKTSKDSAGQISSFDIPLGETDALENTQSPNVPQQMCNFNGQEISLQESEVNAISQVCLEKQGCELMSEVLNTESAQMTNYSNLAYPEINNLVKLNTAQSLNTFCEEQSENQTNQLLCDTSCHSMDVVASKQNLHKVPTICCLNATSSDYTEEEDAKNENSIEAFSQLPFPNLGLEENVHSMSINKTTDSDDECEANKVENMMEITPMPGSASECTTTRLTPSVGRITRSMARINYRKQKQKKITRTSRAIKSKQKLDPENFTSDEPQDITDCIVDGNVLDSKMNDISDVPECDQDKPEEDKKDRPRKKRKMPDGQKRAVKSTKRAKIEKNEASPLDSTSTCLMIRSSGMVSCRQCHLEFKNYGTFIKHTCKSDKRVFTCKHCDLYFDRPQKYHNHVNNHIRNNCKICGAQFTKREDLNKHNKLEHHGLVEPEKFYHCPLCEQKFVKKPSLYAHLKEHADLKIVCMKCGAMCDGEEQYSQHMAKHAEEANFHCDKCNENFLWRQQYEQHIAGHEKYKCALCDTDFCTKKQLVKHRRMVHGIKIQEEKKYECTICQKRFQRQTMLKMHVAMHNGETPLQCSICSKNYRTFKSLSKHMKTAAHLKQSGLLDEKTSSLDKSFLCAECGAKFYRKQGLARHMQQLHSEDRPFECSFCDYTCKCKTNLKRHVELHKNERRFVCELCGSSFHAHGTLKEHHAYVHSEDRQFVCQNCGKGFKGRSGLRRHIRSHSDNRPFVCYCGQSYKRMSHLKRHMMAIHGIAFKSKRVQRIGSDDQSSSTHDDSNPSTHFQYVEAATDFAPIDAALQSQTITLPVTSTNGLLIIDNPSQATQEMAQSMTLEVSDVIPRLQIPQSESQLLPQTMVAVDQLSVQNSTHIPLLSPTSESLSNSCMLPSIMDTSDLNQSFDLGNVSIPISNCGISVAPTLPSLNPQTIYHTVQTMDSALAFPLQPSMTDLTNPNMQTLPPEFYTQSLAQYMSCSQPELI